MPTTLRNALIAAALGAASALLVAAVVLPASAQNAPGAVGIDNFTFNPQKLTVKAGTTVTWTNNDDIPHAIAAANKQFKSKATPRFTQRARRHFHSRHPEPRHRRAR